jgi:hypothetical protein
VQGVGLPGLSVLKGAGALVSIDARPLMLAFAICAGAAVYFSLPFEPEFERVPAGAGVLFLLWLVAPRWGTSESAIMAVIGALGISIGVLAGSLRTQRVDAPVVTSEARPAMVEGWVHVVESGRKGVRLLLRVHSVAGLADRDWPETMPFAI